MALDNAILECRARDLTPNTIRFLQFSPPAALVGLHQTVEHEIRVEYCKSNGIDINRRITGGGAIFFNEKSLGWEIIASKADLNFYRPTPELYRRMCEGAVAGLKALGVDAKFRGKNDIEVNGRKISGTGGTSRGGAFLFQGTLLIDLDVEIMLKVLRIPVMKLKDKEIRSVKKRVTCLDWELGYTPSISEVKGVLKAGFEQILDIHLVKGGLTVDESKFFSENLSRFESDEWIYLQRRPLDDATEVHSINKTAGGLVRVSLAVDKQLNIIKSALITGDFFVFPSRAVLDLEANLKNISFDEEEIRKTVHNFFKSSEVEVLGVKPEDFIKLILDAISKTTYDSVGLSPFEANSIYTVNGSFMDILNNGCDTLLLPYCAKLLACEYRYRDGCEMCGKCSVGVAYRLAKEANLRPITIQNYEHLTETLEKLKQKRIKGYIGCCCEAFYCKHQNDLEKAGVPGILIDVNSQTCYDLGKEADGYTGNFESQTGLKIEILQKLTDFLRRKHYTDR
jgi:lipoate-protein ligase A